MNSIYVLDIGYYEYELIHNSNIFEMNLYCDNNQISSIDLHNRVFDMDQFIDVLLYNIGINELWDYC